MNVYCNQLATHHPAPAVHENNFPESKKKKLIHDGFLSFPKKIQQENSEADDPKILKKNCQFYAKKLKKKVRIAR